MKLKKFLLMGLIIMAGNIVIQSQGFTVTTYETEKDCPINQLTQFHIDVKNDSDNDLTFRIIKRRVNLPDEWGVSLCWDVCFPPWIDTLVTDEDFGLSPLPPGETKTLDIDVTPSNEDVGSLRIIIAQIRNLLDTRIIDITANGVVAGLEDEMVLNNYYLDQNYPNPFNPETKIKFNIRESAFTTLSIYNILGVKLFDLVDEYKTAGVYEINFDASNLPTGIYLYRLKSKDFAETKRMLLLK